MGHTQNFIIQVVVIADKIVFHLLRQFGEHLSYIKVLYRGFTVISRRTFNSILIYERY